MKNFVESTLQYLEQYHRRSNSELGFAADKKMLGWNIPLPLPVLVGDERANTLMQEVTNIFKVQDYWGNKNYHKY